MHSFGICRAYDSNRGVPGTGETKTGLTSTPSDDMNVISASTCFGLCPCNPAIT